MYLTIGVVGYVPARFAYGDHDWVSSNQSQSSGAYQSRIQNIDAMFSCLTAIIVL